MRNIVHQISVKNKNREMVFCLKSLKAGMARKIKAVVKKFRDLKDTKKNLSQKANKS